MATQHILKKTNSFSIFDFGVYHPNYCLKTIHEDMNFERNSVKFKFQEMVFFKPKTFNF